MQTEQYIENVEFDENVSAERITESSSRVEHGRKSGIGATAVQLTSSSIKCTGVYLKRPTTEVGVVYVGNSDVTADSADATDGFPIEAGDSVFVSVDDPSTIYLIGSTTSLKVFYMLTY